MSGPHKQLQSSTIRHWSPYSGSLAEAWETNLASTSRDGGASRTQRREWPIHWQLARSDEENESVKVPVKAAAHPLLTQSLRLSAFHHPTIHGAFDT